MVQHQMSFSLLVSNLISELVDFEQCAPSAPLDQSQRFVAEWTGGPLLVEAGPGTGKTKTLVGRIEFLLSQNVHPTSILSLTFSNKAAEEMRSRVAIAARDIAHQIWIGTFHAFGLELLRKYGFKIGINPDFKILDPIDGIFLLEERLQSLNLVHYRNLYDPTMYLPDILSAISRAKDELVDPDSYMALAEEMIISAGSDEKKRTAGDKAVEVARVYKIYQQHLESESLLDFGDLIFRSVLLLQGNPDVSEDIQSMYTHILVDEYQDVNRASGVLLREVAHSGSGLWVVGDTRQSIYRFRGAAPTNMQKFDEDFPGATKKPLEVNYRSRPTIIKTFATLAPKMKATLGASFIPWKPHRDSEPGAVKMEIAENLDAEVSGIASEIQYRKSSGCNFRDQAILCRSHTTMARLGTRLEAAGVPILYLGDLFEREEIRDILSLLSLASKGDGRGLVRVSAFPEYQIPLSDVTTLFSYAKENDIPFPQAIEMARNVAAISRNGKKGLMLLASHLEGIDFITSAWGMLVRYLFDRSSYLDSLLVDNSLAAQQKRLAIHQFLEFAHDQRNNSSSNGSDPKRVFLEYVRRLEIHGEERHLRQVPDWASGIDAVRLLSVHASKGLEFDSVFIPYLGKGFFPARKQGKYCPPPDKMLPPNMAEGSHEEEEECLFFVALSRARDYLCLSRAVRYGEKESNPSDLLESIKTCLPRNYWSSRFDWTVIPVLSGQGFRF
jgi:superfamily I DNA/RNA helicase